MKERFLPFAVVTAIVISISYASLFSTNASGYTSLSNIFTQLSEDERRVIEEYDKCDWYKIERECKENPPSGQDCSEILPKSNFPNFPQKLCTAIPHDIKGLFKAKLTAKIRSAVNETEKDNARRLLQRLHDIFSWRSFIAVNWPIKGTKRPRWTKWANSHEIFQCNGSKPKQCYSEIESSTDNPDSIVIAYGTRVSGTLRLIEKKQESGHTLKDNDGNIIYYEAIFQTDIVEDICKLELYNINGQINFLKKRREAPKEEQCINFHWGKYGQSSDDLAALGALALRLTWKRLGENEDPTKFLTRTYEYFDKTWKTDTFGLVGMHIAHSTTTSGRKWIWSTFEHKENYQVEILAKRQKPQGSEPRSLFPFSLTKPPSDFPSTTPISAKTTDTATSSTTDNTATGHGWPGHWGIGPDTQDLNKRIHELLSREGNDLAEALECETDKDANCVWLKNYRLVGTQFPERGEGEVCDASGIGSTNDLVNSLLQGIEKWSRPNHLSNSVMETYTALERQSCMKCHAEASRAYGCCKDANGEKQILQGPHLTANFSFQLEDAQWGPTDSEWEADNCSQSCSDFNAELAGGPRKRRDPTLCRDEEAE